MKVERSNILAYLMLVVFLGITTGVNAETWESIKKKEVSQSFPVSKNSLLFVDNRFGNITVTHWGKSEASIRVEIESAASREQVAQKNLERVRIDLNKSGDRVSGITSLGDLNENNSKNQRLTINYYISIPAYLNIELSQRFGNINLPSKNEGESRLTVKYGNINSGSFTKNLMLDAKYSNVKLQDLINATLSLGYCGEAELGNSKQLDIESKYSGLKIGNSDDVKLIQKYGNLKAGNLKKAFMDIKYSNSIIEKLQEELIVESLDYSTLKVLDLNDGFKRVEASSRYGTLEIEISPKAAFQIQAERVGDNLEIRGLKETKHNVENKIDHYVDINGGGSRKINFNGNKYSNLKIKAK